jgi:hypothetical protein
MMIEANIWDTFQEVGFEFDTSREPYPLRFNEEKMRRSPGFQEIWALDFPFEKLSIGRQRAKQQHGGKSPTNLRVGRSSRFRSEIQNIVY